MSANIREILIGFGKGKQTDIATANLVANIWQRSEERRVGKECRL